MTFKDGKLGVGSTVPNSKFEVGVQHDYDQDEEMRIGSYYQNKFYGLGLNYRIGSTGAPSNHIVSFNGGIRHTVMTFLNQNVLIGKTSQQNSDYKLDVSGPIRANEIKVNLSGADFVFEQDYRLRSLEEVEMFISKNKHLPEIAPANEMEKDGASLGELNTKLLQKIEELTLYMIEQNKKTNKLIKDVQELKSDNKTLKANNKKLKEKIKKLEVQ